MNSPQSPRSIHLSSFKIKFHDHILHGDTYRQKCATLVLHGAGQSSRSRFASLRKNLNDLSIPSAAFDFIGHGQTGGNITDTSLKLRTDQAAAVIQEICQLPLTLIGASMSAHTAIMLTRLFEVNNLVLLVPAVYTPAAYHIPFGPEFSAVIRQTDSWQDSEAFDILTGFRGNLLVIAAENDHVIPRQIPHRLLESATSANDKSLFTVPDSGHLNLFRDPAQYRRVIDMVSRLYTL